MRETLWRTASGESRRSSADKGQTPVFACRRNSSHYYEKSLNDRSMTRGVEEAQELIIEERDADLALSDGIQEEPGTEGGQEDKETCQGKQST